MKCEEFQAQSASAILIMEQVVHFNISLLFDLCKAMFGGKLCF